MWAPLGLVGFPEVLFKDDMKYLSASPQRPRFDGNGVASLHATPGAVVFFCPCIVCGPRSCRPQPLGSCRETAPCEDTTQEHGPQFKHRIMSPKDWETCALCTRVSFDGSSPRRGGPSCGGKMGLCQDEQGPYPSRARAANARDPPVCTTFCTFGPLWTDFKSELLAYF